MFEDFNAFFAFDNMSQLLEDLILYNPRSAISNACATKFVASFAWFNFFQATDDDDDSKDAKQVPFNTNLFHAI